MAARTVTTYRPTPDQWAHGLAAYVRDVVERDRGPRSGVTLGLCKIVPPDGAAFWKSGAQAEALCLASAAATPSVTPLALPAPSSSAASSSSSSSSASSSSSSIEREHIL